MAMGDSYWAKPLAWNKQASAGAVGKDGKHWIVFAGDMCDIFDKAGLPDERERMWDLIKKTPHLTWLLLSKRPQNFAKYLPVDWGEGYANVWLGVTCEDHKHGYPRVDILRNTPASVRFLSCEPLLEDISDIDITGINWVITGGESGGKSREFDLAWARALKDRCTQAGVAFFFKQLGSKPVEDGGRFDILHPQVTGKSDRHGKASANFPPDLQVQAWPESASPTSLSGPPSILSAGQKAAETRKRNAAAKRDGVGSAVKPELHLVSNANTKDDIQPEALGLSDEEHERVVQWLTFHARTPSPIGHVAAAALASVAALTQMLAVSLGRRIV
jgi:protein gp37